MKALGALGVPASQSFAAQKSFSSMSVSRGRVPQRGSRSLWTAFLPSTTCPKTRRDVRVVPDGWSHTVPKWAMAPSECGASRRISWNARNARTQSSASHLREKVITRSGTTNVRNVNEVLIPKLPPPPPHRAQNSSFFGSSVDRDASHGAVGGDDLGGEQ